MRKKIITILVFLLVISFGNTTIKANNIQVDERNLTLEEYEEKLQENEINDKDLPLPFENKFKESWIKSTKKILVKKNNGYRIDKIIDEGNSVTFVFEPLNSQILEKIRKKDNEITVKAFTRELIEEEQWGYLASVTYETSVVGQTRIDQYYNSSGITKLDDSGLIRDLNSAATMALTVLSFVPNSTIQSVLFVIDLIEICVGIANLDDYEYGDNNLQVITNVENIYKTRQVWGYSGIVWVIGAQVQRQEQYKYIYTYEKDPVSNKIIDTHAFENISNATLSNYDTWRDKDHYWDDEWLKNRALMVAAGQETLYRELFKVYFSGAEF